MTSYFIALQLFIQFKKQIKKQVKYIYTSSRNRGNGLPVFVFISFMLTVPTQAQIIFPESPDYAPKTYIVQKATDYIHIDGKLNEPDWLKSAWTNPFLDIRGESAPEPIYQTRAKMLWDDHYFYYAAELEDPHVWATITERDAVIFMDNNFEIFIDPDGDTHNYYELEINALGTYWDLLLTKPYRNGGRAINAWDIKGLKIGISVNGTLNDHTDTDKGWNLEVAIPWSVLMETIPGSLPVDGDQWRLNFSRVQWHTDIINGEYIKQTDPETGEHLPEENWSWSPQGLINMHYPEMWGFLQFSDEPAGAEVPFEWLRIEEYKWLMRILYYRQLEHRNQTGRYADSPDLLQFQELFRELFDDHPPIPELTISAVDQHYLMKLESTELEQTVYIQSDSRVWTENR